MKTAVLERHKVGFGGLPGEGFHGGAGTITLRPAASGSVCGIVGQTGLVCPNHWANVDEVVADEDITVVYSEATPGVSYDMYDKDASGIVSGVISGIVIGARCRRNTTVIPGNLQKCAGPLFRVSGQAVDAGYCATFGSAAVVVFAGGSPDADRLSLMTTAWTNYETSSITLNPATGLPWVWADIASLQIGIGLRRSESAGIGLNTRCTQLWLEVTYG